MTVLWVAATTVLLVFTVLLTLHRITWYLAVDQFGYLTFAHDLLHGRVFHEWPPIKALASRLPAAVDVLSQTYIFDQEHGRLYCRYAPGFPILLAGWLGLFGDDGAHYLNPTVFIALLLVVLAFQARVFRSRWRATAGVALIILCPTGVQLWATTLVRDLPTHLFALAGLTLLLPVGEHALGAWRTGAAWLALGYAGSIRPDALIYVLPGALMTGERWWRERPRWTAVLLRIGAGLLAVLLGLAPFLAYNWMATGSPFRPTQGMEAQEFLTTSSAAPPAGPALARVGFAPAAPPGSWHGGIGEPIQGGALRLTNLPRVLPENINVLRGAYGDPLLGLAIWGAVLALFQRRLLFFGPATYAVLALVFYSCWPRADAGGRYLAGVHVVLPMLIIEGTLGTIDLVRRLAASRGASIARGAALTYAVLAVAGAVLMRPEAPSSALPALFAIVPGVAAAAALGAAFRPALATVAAPLLALALVTTSCVRTARLLDGPRARFQRPEMVSARTTFAQAVEPEAVVITTEDVGRPGENIDYYSRVAHALYLTDLDRWRVDVPDAAELIAKAGMNPYLLIPTNLRTHDRMLRQLRKPFVVELVADIPAAQAMDYFVAAAFYPRGIHMELYRLRWRGPWWPILP